MASRIISILPKAEATTVRAEAPLGYSSSWNRSGLLEESTGAIKRLFDVVSACFFILLFLPVGFLIAAAIRIETRGPVLFRHTRIGKGNRHFTLFKFRSMAEDSEKRLADFLSKHPELEEEWAATHKLKDDPRVTRVGRFLRRTSLDELPQFWNILKGDMSLIGPRPIVDEEVPKYRGGFLLYTRVRPGLTGLWQVSGRSDTSYPRRVELDTRYIREWTLGMDLRIIWKTVGVVLRANGAY